MPNIWPCPLLKSTHTQSAQINTEPPFCWSYNIPRSAILLLQIRRVMTTSKRLNPKMSLEFFFLSFLDYIACVPCWSRMLPKPLIIDTKRGVRMFLFARGLMTKCEPLTKQKRIANPGPISLKRPSIL